MKQSLLVFVAVASLLIATLLLHNRTLFHTPVYEDGDYATNSILVLEAKKFRLLVGNYSRMGFNHPGPALLYWLAAAEATLYDLLHAVPAPHNAQIIGQEVLHALLVGLTLLILAAHWRASVPVAVAAALVIGSYALTGVLAHHWFPYVYCTIFLAFAVSVASTAAGCVGHGWIVVLTGSLLVHGHVGFVMFVVPLALWALFRALRPYHYRFGPFVRENAGTLALAVALLALFLLPIVLNTILNFPGEIARYAGMPGGGGGGGGGEAGSSSGFADRLVGALTYCVRCMSGLALLPGSLYLLGLVSANALLLPRRNESERRRISVQLLGVAGATAFLLFVYALFVVDDVVHVYTGYFAGSVSIILLAVAGLNAATVLERSRVGRRLALGMAATGLAAALVLGTFTSPYPGATYLPQLREKLRQDPLWDRAPLVLSFSSQPPHWEAAAAVLVDQLRQGRQPYLANLDLAFLFSGRISGAGWDDRDPILRLHLDYPGLGPTPVLFTRAETTDPERRFALYRLDRVYALGSEAVLRQPPGRAVLGQGWSMQEPEPIAAQRMAEPMAFRFVLAPAVAKPLIFSLVAGVHSFQEPAPVAYDVFVNGARLARWEYDGADFVEKRVRIPADLAARCRPLLIRLETVTAADALSGPPRPVLWAKAARLEEAPSDWSNARRE